MTSVKNLAEQYDAPTMEWDAVRGRLDSGFDQAPGSAAGPGRHTCWLTTLNSDGSPHTAAVGALWVDDALWFETGARTRKGRNVAGDPRCSMAVSLLEFDLVVEGAAEMITEPAVVATMAGHWADQGWPAEPDETGTALTAPYSAQSAGPPPWQVYRIQPTSAYALQTVEPFGATRWRF